MEMDFKTVKALSSQTRIQILNCILERERTPTEISKDVNKSKSTVSSHLEKLLESELIVKNKEDGRKRVIYEPTNKAEHIVKGKEKKVRFSITSSIISTLAGFGLLFSTFSFLSQPTLDDTAEGYEAEAEDDLTMMDSPEEEEETEGPEPDFETEGAEASELPFQGLTEYLLPGISVLLLLAGVFLAWQGYSYLKLSKEE